MQLYFFVMNECLGEKRQVTHNEKQKKTMWIVKHFAVTFCRRQTSRPDTEFWNTLELKEC